MQREILELLAEMNEEMAMRGLTGINSYNSRKKRLHKLLKQERLEKPDIT